MICCPNCGYKEKIEAAERMDLTQTEKVIYNLLEKHSRVSIERITDSLWGDDPNGGPDYALGNIRVHVTHIRRKMKEHNVPYKIVPGYGRGYKLEKLA